MTRYSTKPDISISQSQALQIMAISVMLKDGELTIDGDDADAAVKALEDAGEEIALQVGGVSVMTLLFLLAAIAIAYVGAEIGRDVWKAWR